MSENPEERIIINIILIQYNIKDERGLTKRWHSLYALNNELLFLHSMQHVGRETGLKKQDYLLRRLRSCDKRGATARPLL
jgi:hypothetical protein